MAVAYCYQYQVSAMASQQTAQTSSQASAHSSQASAHSSPYSPQQHQYSRRDPSSLDGYSHSPHRRSHSLSGHHAYNEEFLFPERQSRRSGARQELALSHTISQSRSPPRSGTIRMPIIEQGSHDDGWVMPTTRHFTPLPAPGEERQREYRGHRRRYSVASPTLLPGEWAPSASRSTSPCSVGSSRRSSRSSEKRVTFAREPEIF
ncbi:hypothetical protein L211DRAFT_842194 [Terfezia boudieri ATCC MYA-4762]|uniref:Uncharacterized protein n=1 Tax=Terfezia boudieri ATCC MYA-4762 TaxID=1051890 RepID=A0A3N4LAU6_9PEZI|nr:hypothetical protein L211DRAFT_842194 [Terfezia boudieri ATCC MYA-4762]